VVTVKSDGKQIRGNLPHGNHTDNNEIYVELIRKVAVRQKSEINNLHEISVTETWRQFHISSVQFYSIVQFYLSVFLRSLMASDRLFKEN
jgi:hypothetical protein